MIFAQHKHNGQTWPPPTATYMCPVCAEGGDELKPEDIIKPVIKTVISDTTKEGDFAGSNG